MKQPGGKFPQDHVGGYLAASQLRHKEVDLATRWKTLARPADGYPAKLASFGTKRSIQPYTLEASQQ